MALATVFYPINNPSTGNFSGLREGPCCRPRTVTIVVLLSILFTPLCWAGDDSSDNDLRSASLEDLMGMRLVASNVLGIHHAHPVAEWMISYRYMRMRMAGNRVGTDSVSESEVLEDFMVTPTSMDMEMHMVGLMFAPTQKLTLMAMVPFHRLSMEHLTRMGTRFTTSSEGLGDLKVSALYTFYSRENHRLHFDAGFNLPTGSIDERGDTPAGANQRLPYPMQLGSGTYDPRIGLTYLAARDDLSWGGHMRGIFRLGRNANDYRLGNQYVLDGWGSYRWNDWLSSSVRTIATFLGDIHGADPTLNPMMVPTANPQLRGGKRVDLSLGLSLFVPDGKLFGNRLSAEIASPLYQSLHGPQLERDWTLSLGWQYIWNF